MEVGATRRSVVDGFVPVRNATYEHSYPREGLSDPWRAAGCHLNLMRSQRGGRSSRSVTWQLVFDSEKPPMTNRFRGIIRLALLGIVIGVNGVLLLARFAEAEQHEVVSKGVEMSERR